MTADEGVVVKHSIDTPYYVGIVHLYEYRSREGVVLFDTGPPTRDAMAYWRNNFDLENLKYLFITHCHPDHFGLMEFLENESGAKVIVSRKDIAKYKRMDLYLKMMREMFDELGFPPDETEFAEKTLEEFQKAIPLSKVFHYLEDSNEVLRSLDIDYISCPGHSQTDIVYLFDGHAVTGDVILREIFTAPLLDIVADTFGGRFRNYAAYCSTIPKLKSIENLKLLPAHRDYIDSVDERISWFVEKLVGRASAIAPLFKSGKTVYDAVCSLPGIATGEYFKKYIKASEIVFIKDFLEEPALLTDQLERAGLYDALKEKIETAVA